MSEQLGFNFEGAPGSASGIALWREARKAHLAALALKSGLPLAHRVRIRLASGLTLEGRLQLAKEELCTDQRRSPELRFLVGRVEFRGVEIESCVRLD